MLVRLSIIGAVTALLMVPATLSAQGIGGTVSTSVSRGIPTAADLERSSRSASHVASPTVTLTSMAVGTVRRPQPVILKIVESAGAHPS